MTASIVGWAHTPFGKFDNETVESLIVRAATEAMADAGMQASDIDEIVLGHFNAGFSPQDFTASLVLQASPELRFKRASRVENACATGSAAVHQGLKAIAARSARIVLVVGAEQMTTTPAPEIGRNLLKASYVREEADIDGGFAGSPQRHPVENNVQGGKHVPACHHAKQDQAGQHGNRESDRGGFLSIMRYQMVKRQCQHHSHRCGGNACQDHLQHGGKTRQPGNPI